jgi:hypothetical protein
MEGLKLSFSPFTISNGEVRLNIDEGLKGLRARLNIAF